MQLYSWYEDEHLGSRVGTVHVLAESKEAAVALAVEAFRVDCPYITDENAAKWAALVESFGLALSACTPRVHAEPFALLARPGFPRRR